MAPRTPPSNGMGCTRMVWDAELEKLRPCKFKKKTGLLCWMHAKTEGPPVDPEDHVEGDFVEGDSLLSEVVEVEDDIITSMQELTLANDKNDGPEEWKVKRSLTTDSSGSFGLTDPDLRRWAEYMPKNLSNSVYKNVFQYLLKGPSNEQPGFVYIALCTPTWRALIKQEPLIIKIGKSKSVEKRMKQLESSCGSYKFEPIYSSPQKIELPEKAEKLSQKSLDNRTYHPKNGRCICGRQHREVFKIKESELQQVIKIVKHWVEVVERREEIWPGISFNGRKSI